MLAVNGNGGLIMYRGNGAGRFLSPYPQIGSGWGSFTALLATDWSGDGRPDLLARKSDGGLLMYRGNARGGFATGTGETIGSGWGGFTALLAPGDFSGDGKKDLLARQSDGSLLLYRGNGDSGFAAAGSRSAPAGAASPRCSPQGTGTATARPTCSPARPTGSCCSTAATARAAG